MKDGEEDKVKVAVKILSMSKDEVDEALNYVSGNLIKALQALSFMPDCWHCLYQLLSWILLFFVAVFWNQYW